MARFLFRKQETRGLAPGTLVFTGEARTEKTYVEIISYSSERFHEEVYHSIEEFDQVEVDKNLYRWINVVGVHQVEWIEYLGKIFNLHSLLLEDVMDTGQRPKLEEYENLLFTQLKMFQIDPEEDILAPEQISFVLSGKVLITFQEVPGDVFATVRSRLRKTGARIRSRGLDYLQYALMDNLVDQYIFIIENYGEKIEDLEKEILGDASRDLLERINDYKMEMNFFRKSIRPAYECILRFAKSDLGFVSKKTTPFVKDLLDMITHANESVDAYRDLLSDYLNIYHTKMTNKLNDIIRVLTIFSVIFIPITFLAGVYGTNFRYFPELEYKYAYPIFWGVMIIVAGTMLIYFKRKGWL